MPPTFHDLAAEQYVSLMTFRRNGVGVARPIWIAPIDGKLYAVTDRRSAKMKHLCVTDRIRLAACDVLGNVRGEWADGRSSTIEEPVVIARAVAALSRKYRWRFCFASFFSRLSGRIGERAWLEITL
jgi:uncharacterized protein